MKAQFRDMANPAVAVALSFGLGLASWAPGTFGAAGAFLPYFAIWQLGWAWQAILTILLFALGCAVCDRTAAYYKVEDHSAIVWDETIGMLMVLVLSPATPLCWLLGFVAFRVLDIRKPWPIHLVETHLRGGLAVMLDDAAAALGAAGIVWLAYAGVVQVFTV
ncbi:phosphatidylglycerophosphatase A [Aestuariivirga sp.]|uniref:phosphatidylglycerophosphatase A family protein n=1 Tax=Aestuariivirga sp. TaxID=2650926 RepID=UPI003BAADBE9